MNKRDKRILSAGVCMYVPDDLVYKSIIFVDHLSSEMGVTSWLLVSYAASMGSP